MELVHNAFIICLVFFWGIEEEEIINLFLLLLLLGGGGCKINPVADLIELAEEIDEPTR